MSQQQQQQQHVLLVSLEWNSSSSDSSGCSCSHRHLNFLCLRFLRLPSSQLEEQQQQQPLRQPTATAAVVPRRSDSWLAGLAIASGRRSGQLKMKPADVRERERARQSE